MCFNGALSVFQWCAFSLGSSLTSQFAFTRYPIPIEGRGARAPALHLRFGQPVPALNETTPPTYRHLRRSIDAYAPSAVGERIRELCREFRLPTLAAETVDRFSDAGHADALPTLVEVLEQEAEDRRIRRVDRLRRASKLPAGKTWDTFEHERAPVKLRQQLVRLAEGDFVDRDVNVLAFGLPGTGKTHAMCAIGHRLVQSGRSVLFIPAYRLVQDMLAAKRDLDLPRMLRKLDNFDLLVIDDLGYLPQGAEESEVLFTLIAERYERRSLGITSNLVFSEWEKVFRQPDGDSRRDRQDRASLGHP